MPLMTAQIIGYVAAEPSIKYTPRGLAIFEFVIPMKDESYANREKSAKERKTYWVKVKAIGQLAEALSAKIKKGTQVFAVGQFHFEAYVSKDGVQSVAYVLDASNVFTVDAPEPAQETEEEQAVPF